jgi:hypothetical protein
MALALVSLALTFVSHDLRGQPRKHS